MVLESAIGLCVLHFLFFSELPIDTEDNRVYTNPII